MEIEDEYIPKKINQYYFDIFNKLENNENNEIYQNNIHEKNVYICPYEVNNDGIFPFIKYLLYKDFNSEKLEFLMIDNHLFNMNNKKLIFFIKNYLFNIFIKNNVIIDNFEQKINFKGEYIVENNVYLFFDLTNCKIKLNDIYKKNEIWFCLIDEIMNTCLLCDMKINKTVSNFFTLNNDFVFLYNEEKIKYQIPTVLYVSKPDKYLNFTYNFGVSKSDKNSILGPYYYFTDFENSIKQIQKKRENENEKYGIVRIAVFTNNLLIKENCLNELNDNSEIKMERLNDQKLNRNYEILTLRISDHDGIWAEEYDSVLLSNIELDNGQFLKDTPIFAVKNYEQQIPLSYHYINNKYLIS
jgi:hypothetical protein